MTQRASIREFDSSRSIPQEHLNFILRATQQSPTSITGQQYSIIVIDDPDKKKFLTDHTIASSGNPMTFIEEAPIVLLFVVDFHKIEEAFAYEGSEMKITDSIQSLLIGTVDVGIAAEATTIAAESLGLGTVMIGALRRASSDIIAEFGLPSKTIPLLGLAIGYPLDPSPPKMTPRLPLSSLVHKNQYEAKDFSQYIAPFNLIIKEHNKLKKGIDRSWTEGISLYYSKIFNTELSDLYRQQGFHF